MKQRERLWMSSRLRPQSVQAPLILMLRDSSPQGDNIFPLCLVLSEALLARFDNRDLVESLKRRSQVTSLTFDRSEGQDKEDRGLISIKDRDADKVMRCFRLFVDEYTRIDSQDNIKVVMLIPDRMVALVIGRGGKQINKLSSSSNTAISILEQTHSTKDRKVSIDGEHSAVEVAVKEIYSMIIRNRLSGLEGCTAKFIIPSNCAGFIIGRDGYFTKHLRDSFNVDVKIMKADGPPCTDTESIVVSATQTLNGSLVNCKAAVEPLLAKIGDALSNIDTSNSNLREKTRLIVQGSMATKIIGRKGETVREIMRKAAGSSIHVMSDKNAGRDQGQVEVNIRGPLPARAEATVLILDRVNEILNPTIHSPDRVEIKPRSPVIRRSRSRSRSPRTEINVAVPESLVSRLIGKRGDNVRSLMTQSGCVMNYQPKSDQGILTSGGSQARLVTVQGSTRSIATGVKLLLEQILEFEKRDLP
jgi:predicted PilT family ATPase